MKKCIHCNEPNGRRANSLYCSIECYNSAKKIRDSLNYKKSSTYQRDFKLNESILARYYPLCIKGEYIPVMYLENEHFNWDRYDQMFIRDENRHYRIGQYAYSLLKSADNNKYINICKLQ